MTDIRFDSIEDGELADIWYALGGAAVHHPDHFKPLMDAVFAELLDRRGEAGLNPWPEQRFRAFRFEDSRRCGCDRPRCRSVRGITRTKGRISVDRQWHAQVGLGALKKRVIKSGSGRLPQSLC